MQARDGVKKTTRSKFKRTISPETAEKIIVWQQALPENERNDALIDDCLAVLAEANQPKVDWAEKEEVWQNIVCKISKYEDSKAKQEVKFGKRGFVARRPIRASLIACCLLFVTVGVALASGLLPWQLTINRDNGSFELQIVSTNERQSKTEIASAALPSQFVDRLGELGFDVALPRYWPEGYSYSHMEENTPNEIAKYVICHFTHGMSSLKFSVEPISDEESSGNDYLATYEMSGDEIRTYTNDNGSYIIYANNMYMNAIWIDGGYLLSMVGNISEEEMIRIIDSIDMEG